MTAFLIVLIAATVAGAVNYSIRQGQCSVAYFIGGLTGLPALALVPGLIWAGDARTTAALLWLLAIFVYGHCWWWFIRKYGFKRAGQMTLILSLITSVVFAATYAIQHLPS